VRYMSVLINITYFTTIYVGSTIYFFGFVSNLLNIRVLYSNRNNPCTFLLIYSSIVDCFVLNIGLLQRILAVGFQIDPTLSNKTWCKTRTYGLRISTVISFYMICLMSMDQFFITCRTVRWRQLSNLSFVRSLAILITCLIAIEGLPYFILTEIIRTASSISCTPMYNPIFAKYASFFNIPIIFGILPLSILVSMGLLIYYKLHNRTHLRQAQRSLTSIILCRIILVILSCGPYTSYFVYSAIISIIQPIRSVERLAVENFILSIVSVFLYLTYSTAFFVHYSISSTFRKQVLQLFKRSRRVDDVNLSQQPTQVDKTRPQNVVHAEDEVNGV